MPIVANGKLYAIMRFAKIKSFNALAHVCAHNTRAVMGENIREDAPPPRELLETGSDDFCASVHEMLDELKIDRSSLKDKVLAVETVATASRGWFEKATDEEKQQWLDANVEWARKKFGRGLITAKLHLDEEVWHIHFVAMPVVEKANVPRGAPPRDPAKRAEYERRKATAEMRWTLSYHDILGGSKERFVQEQDTYHAAVAHLGLERGETQREDLEIRLGDELTVSALALARGHNPDGTAKPRRSMTPADGRKEVKRLRREAEAAKQEAEAARERAEAELVAASAAHTRADHRLQDIADLQAQTTLQREEAAAMVQEVQRERIALAEERALLGDESRRVETGRRDFERAQAEAERRQSEQGALLDHRADEIDVRERVQKSREEEIARRERKVDALEREAAQARAAAERARIEIEDALLAAVRSGEMAAADAREAKQQRSQAEAERITVREEREALAIARTRLAEEQAGHASQLALLARASDPVANLNLRATETSLSMNTTVMTASEKTAYTKPWSAPLVQIGRQIARMLEELRARVARLLAREKAVAERETVLAARENAAERDLAERRDDLRRKHEVAVAEIARRGETLRREEVRVAGLLKEADTKWEAARQKEVDANAAIASNARWAVAVDMIGDHLDCVEITEVGALRLDPRRAPVLPASIINTFETKPPSWALAIIGERQILAENIALAQKHESEAAGAAERLTGLIAKAGAVLTPVQQEMTVKVEQDVKRWAAANFRSDLGR